MLQPLLAEKIVVAGGSGFVGTALAHHFVDRGAEVVVLTRGSLEPVGPWRVCRWDGRTLDTWAEQLNNADALVNLAGRSVNCIKSPDHQDEILRSRVESTRILGEAVRSIVRPPPVWIQMSTAHLYGDPPEALCTENSAFGYGLAPTVAKAWEETFCDSRLPSQRAVILRTSFVLGRDRGAGAGALATLSRLARWGLGGKVGHGRQGISWIHETDLNRLIEHAIAEQSMEGAYVASSPHPVSQAEFMRELRRAVRMPIGAPAPAWLVRLGCCLLLRTDPELALYGRYVVSNRLAEDGFEFQFAELQEALAELFQNKRRGSPRITPGPAACT